MRSSLVFLTILCLCIFITQQASLSNKHQLTPKYNSSEYADELAKRQTEFDNKMKDIQQQVDQLDANISKYQGNNTYQIMKLQEGLADERDSLYDVENLLNQPFASKPCQKPNLTKQQKAELNKQIKATNQSLLNMKSDVKKCTDQPADQCTVPDELIHQITRAELYLEVMDDYVNGNCKRVPRAINQQAATGMVDLNDRLYKDNLKAPNWIYGNITEQQYRLMVFSETTKFNTTTCPIERPYANKVNNTCFACPQGSIFSLGERICKCSEGYKFDEESNQCVSLTPVKPCNQTGTCVSMCPKNKPRWNSINKVCEACPADKPVVDRATSTCAPCPSATPSWNQLTYQCQSCPKNTQFDPTLSKCIPCKDIQKYDQSTQKCVPICNSYQIYNKQEGKCYTLEELNGCKCNQRYNTADRECQDACQNGLQWVPGSNKCGPPALPDFKDQCKYHQRLNPETKQCEDYCDRTIAYYNRQNHVCIKIGCSVECKCGQIFDNLTGKCIPQGHQCPQTGQYYNTTSGQCQIWCTNGMVYNPQTRICQVPNNCAFDESFDAVNKRCVKKCADSFQTYNKMTLGCDCISGYHLDQSTSKCVPNPIQCNQNQRYSPIDNKCVCTDGYIIDYQGNCMAMCDPNQNKYYDLSSHTCRCTSGYVINNNQLCVPVSSICLSSNNQHYDEWTRSCVCNTGYVMNLNDGKCYQERRRCKEDLHFVLNPSTNQCECAIGYKLSIDESRCVSQAEICLLNPNTIFNSVTSTCECLPGYQLTSQSGDVITCLSLCKLDETFNQATQKCVKLCPEDYYYNTTTHSCFYRCPADYLYNVATQQCERTVMTCPDLENQYFDKSTGQCRSCPEGYTLNRNTLLCEKKVATCAAGQFYDNSTGLCLACKPGQTYNPSTKSCDFTNTACSGGMYFDFNAGQCRYCPAGYIYDNALLECRSNCSVDQTFDYTQKKCIMISYTCNSYQYYDAVQRQCVYKPICSSMQRYDEFNNRCIDVSFITSKSANNLIHSNFNAYEAYYDSRRANDKYLRDCPVNTPFYSSSNKLCVYCPQTHPYFDLETEKCLNCGNVRYDPTLRKCINPAQPQTNENTQDLNYSLDRLVMNIA